MKDLKQNIIDALNDATDFEYDKVNTTIFYEYLDYIFDQIPDNESPLTKRVEELEAMLENTLQLNKEVLLQMKDVGVESEIVEFYLPTNISEITELLNKK